MTLSEVVSIVVGLASLGVSVLAIVLSLRFAYWSDELYHKMLSTQTRTESLADATWAQTKDILRDVVMHLLRQVGTEKDMATRDPEQLRQQATMLLKSISDRLDRLESSPAVLEFLSREIRQILAHGEYSTVDHLSRSLNMDPEVIRRAIRLMVDTRQVVVQQVQGEERITIGPKL